MFWFTIPANLFGSFFLLSHTLWLLGFSLSCWLPLYKVETPNFHLHPHLLFRTSVLFLLVYSRINNRRRWSNQIGKKVLSLACKGLCFMPPTEKGLPLFPWSYILCMLYIYMKVSFNIYLDGSMMILVFWRSWGLWWSVRGKGWTSNEEMWWSAFLHP